MALSSTHVESNISMETVNMKKMLITLLTIVIAVSIFAVIYPRTVYQEIATEDIPDWTWSKFPDSDPHYYFEITCDSLTISLDDIVNEYGPGYFCLSCDPNVENTLLLTFDQQFWIDYWEEGTAVKIDLWYREDITQPFDTTNLDPRCYRSHTMLVPAGEDPILEVPKYGHGSFVWIIPPVAAAE